MGRQASLAPGGTRISALDGIRCFAVLAVMASHTPGTGLPGGYFGVDAFFALSGFLITSLLVGEFTRRSSISLGRFWVRRARRLLPALFLLLTAVGIAAAIWPAVYSTPNLRADAVSSIFYVANWHLIAQHTNYFVATGPQSPLLHVWSLAIEEQFYLLWPLVVIGVLGLGRRRAQGLDGPAEQLSHRRRLRMLLVLSCAGAVASAVWMAVLYDPLDTARAYYGSDTRAQALLVGAALALWLALRKPVLEGRARRLVAGAGAAAAAATVALWCLVPDTSALAFRGGFLLAAVFTTAVIACAVLAPRSPLPRFLSTRPATYLGGISYGMYLWYWPVGLALTAERTHLDGYALLGARLLVVVAAATFSAYVIELPIRRGALPSWRASLAAPLAAGISVVSIFAATIAPEAAAAQPASSQVQAATRPGGPLKILLLGDSMAGSLGVGLGEVAGHLGVEVANEGIPGCSLSMAKSSLFLWFTGTPSPPCNPNDPQSLFDTWKKWVDDWNPDAVVYIARGEVLNQQIGSSTQWVHIGQPSFDTRLASRLEDALDVLGSRGARVFLLGSPLYHSGLQDVAISPWQEDQPGRVAEDDSIMRAAVARDPDATFVDVGSWLSPSGRYSAVVDGIDVRCGDGVHFTPAGGRFVAQRLLPVLMASVKGHHETSPGGSWPGGGGPPIGTPAWYPTLPC